MKRRYFMTALVGFIVLGLAIMVWANVPGGRKDLSNTSVPNPGTQQQELANITVPAPYNVFEFVVTCGACHGGTVDQQAAHFGNWSGTNMASSARDPVFRANEIIVNTKVREHTGQDGAGNFCFRCHSGNGWMSGRFDPKLAGSADGRTMIHSIVASTDDEGITCEQCHRSIGAVTMKRPDLDPNDKVWNMLMGLNDWPHQGLPYPEGPSAGNPYGDSTLQLNDGMTYAGKYAGSVNIFFSDQPTLDPATGRPTPYTGQTYGVYPPGWKDPQGNDLGGQPVVNPDGTTPIHFEVPIGPPVLPNGSVDYERQAISLEHPTYSSEFLRSSEFCGSCHDLSVPAFNHGMPEQRTYSEWKYSDFGRDKAAATYRRCQDCHMPTLKHEYSDSAPVSLNPDPALTGWFPYAKDRNAFGGTTFHQFGGANRDLPRMMSKLYPEVDLEVIGAPTGDDTRVFPGLLSSRDISWDRASRNTEISLKDAVKLEIVSSPTFRAGKWEMKVRITNLSGHRIPSGYPDGRRLWVNVQVHDSAGQLVYESGHYNTANALLTTDATASTLARARAPVIDSSANAVMVYEKVTGNCTATSCTPSLNLLNESILFDNRIPPAGFDYASYRLAGARFFNYEPITYLPYEDVGRFAEGQNWDEITYRFGAPASAQLSARVEAYWQTHTRELMEYLKTNDTSQLRPEGPPSILKLNYPLDPTYLSESISQTSGIAFSRLIDLNGQPLRDNWGGIAYASWLLTGKGEPFLVAAADTRVAAPPSKVQGLVVNTVDPFTMEITFLPTPTAEGYFVWTRLGVRDDTASWFKLGVVAGTRFLNRGLNVDKTYGYRVQAFNAKGEGPFSDVVSAKTPADLPLPPTSLTVVGATATTVELSWFDQSDNEIGFIIQRQGVPPVNPFVEIARIPSPHPGATGGVNWTNTGLLPGKSYNYQVAAYNASGSSTFTPPIQASTLGPPSAPTGLVTTQITDSRVGLAWTAATGRVQGYRVERAESGGVFHLLGTVADTVLNYLDTTIQPQQTYSYRVFAFNAAGDSPPSNVIVVKIPEAIPAPPSNLVVSASPNLPPQVALSWTKNSTNEQGFFIQRATNVAFTRNVASRTVGSNVTSGVDTTVARRTTYYYRVRAFNTAGASAFSNTATTRTP